MTGGPIFPANAEVTAIPSAFFSHVLPEMQDIAELRVVLHAFFSIRRKRVFPRYVSRAELCADETLARGFGGRDDCTALIERALAAAVDRRLLVGVSHRTGGELYFINDEQGRRAARRVEAGELTVAPSAPKPRAASEREPLVELYEANFGPVTPMIAEQLAEAQQLFPAQWLPRAMKLAAAANIRRWNYVLAILERWQNEGIDVDEETGRDPEVERLWERYVRGKPTR
ncbi:MAG: DnaD domain protein [Dehalococcoidia bacterium]